MGPSKNLGTDLGTSGGDWLYRHGDLVLGPVPAAQIIDKLYGGELDRRSEVQQLGTGLFRRVAEVDFFKVHLAKAEAKQRVDAAAQSEEERHRRRRNVRVAVVASLAVVGAIAAGLAARYLAVHRPWESGDEALAFADITVDAPVIQRAKASVYDEELIDYPGLGGGSRPKSVTPPSDRKPERPTKVADARPDRKPPPKTTPARTSSDPDGLTTATFDKDAINAVVAQKQKTLFPCLAAAARSKPGTAAKIPIEFVIGNDGRVNKVWVDHPDFKQGALPECLLRELQKWPFKPYEGERATVGLSFRVGKSS